MCAGRSHVYLHICDIATDNGRYDSRPESRRDARRSVSRECGASTDTREEVVYGTASDHNARRNLTLWFDLYWNVCSLYCYLKLEEFHLGTVRLDTSLVSTVSIPITNMINQRLSFYELSITVQYTLCPIDIHLLNYLFNYSLAHTLTSSYNPFRYFIFTSFWAYKIYYVYGFMLLVFVILMIVTVCVTIVCTYFLLNAEDYRW